MPQPTKGPVNAAVAANVRAWRQARGWTLEELCRRSGVRMNTLGKIERDERRIDVDDLMVLAAALEVRVEDLLPSATDPSPVPSLLAVQLHAELEKLRRTQDRLRHAHQAAEAELTRLAAEVASVSDSLNCPAVEEGRG